MITEQQRQEALAICDRLIELNNKVQFHAREAVRIMQEIAEKNVRKSEKVQP